MLNNFELIPIFPIGLIKIKFKDHHKYNFPDIEKKVNKPRDWNCSVNSSFPFIDEHDTLVPPIVKKNLVADLKSSIVEVFKELKMPTNFEFTQFWYNTYRDNQGQEKHNHLTWVGSKNLYWCGIYYNKNSSPTKFHRDPGWYECQRFPNYENTPMDYVLSGGYSPPVEDGDILLFPSYLQHSVESQPYHKDKMRMTFSFNIDLLSLPVEGHEILMS